MKEVIIMYYSAGTYESFAHPEKPEGVDKKSAYIIGTGLAGLTAYPPFGKTDPRRRFMRWKKRYYQGLLYERRT